MGENVKWSDGSVGTKKKKVTKDERGQEWEKSHTKISGKRVAGQLHGALYSARQVVCSRCLTLLRAQHLQMLQRQQQRNPRRSREQWHLEAKQRTWPAFKFLLQSCCCSCSFLNRRRRTLTSHCSVELQSEDVPLIVDLRCIRVNLPYLTQEEKSLTACVCVCVWVCPGSQRLCGLLNH